jgi:hypothetical protein
VFAEVFRVLGTRLRVKGKGLKANQGLVLGLRVGDF